MASEHVAVAESDLGLPDPKLKTDKSQLLIAVTDAYSTHAAAETGMG